MISSSTPLRRWLSAAVVLILAGQACTISLFDTPTNGNTGSTTPLPAVATNTPYAATQTTFVVTLPEPLQAGDSIAVSVLDEVTGLSLNETKFPMTARDSLTYTATLPLPINSVVKYR